ncbi:hypothetical protein BBJ28_00000532 [Nothophytophthora sp. Chile5]|nr:hypothetical protein BBJ28_00000532 [Nothophytophthora sp. Chile5]
MTTLLQLRGEGASALRMYLATHLAADQLQREDAKRLLLGDPKDVLTTAEFRLAVGLLRDLRATSDPAAPRVSFFLHQGQGVRAFAVPTVDGGYDHKQSEKQAKYLAKRREKLQRLDEELRYGHMVRNVKSQSATTEMAHHQKSLKQHLSIGANMVVARITAFNRLLMLQLKLDRLTDCMPAVWPQRIIAGLVGAIAMMVIEMVLFITRAAKFEAIEQEQQKHKTSVF